MGGGGVAKDGDEEAEEEWVAVVEGERLAPAEGTAARGGEGTCGDGERGVRGGGVGVGTTAGLGEVVVGGVDTIGFFAQLDVSSRPRSQTDFPQLQE